MELPKSNLQVVPMAADDNDNDNHNDNDNEVLPPEILVSEFDYSVENHFKVIDKISTLSGESESNYEETDIQHLSSSVTFLRAWRDFRYKPRTLNFACESETPMENDVKIRTNLPQFSSAAVPKDTPDVNKASSPLRKDFVIYVGGHVWGLDWCPKIHQTSDSDINVEFIAVAAHPPESSYHKIGARLTGRGLVQIWCVLTSGQKDQDQIKVKVKPKKVSTNNESNEPKKPRGRPRKNPVSVQPDKPKKPRGRPRKNPISVQTDIPEKPIKTYKRRKTASSVNNLNNSSSLEPRPLSFQFPEDSQKLLTLTKCQTVIKSQVNGSDSFNQSENCEDSLDKDEIKSKGNSLISEDSLEKDEIKSKENTLISEDIALPKLVMGLAHNGKVAYDVKWKPYDSSNDMKRHVMGYLGVLLGNGALEVWEVPHPSATKALFNSCKKEGNDPRFVKLKPVFFCSMLKCGDRQSIPLTLEWSTSAPHDLIMAGCHDGMVAMWKFTANGPSKDTRPLLSFSADTVPIRALKWAPVASDHESANVIATAGHKGLRFWDIRDPYQPLWDIPAQKIIYSLDWLPDPRCLVLSFDDGEIRMISLLKASSEVPVTGMPTVKTQQHGSHSYSCSSSSIWSVQVSTLTGLVAYCCSDGKVIHFQLTTKAVEKDAYRNREPHYLCGSISVEESELESTLTVFSPLPNVPFPMKKSSNVSSDAPRSKRGVLSRSNQEKRTKEEQISNFLKEKPKKKTSQALVCINNDEENEVEINVEEEVIIEKITPKIVAMHRVRWNMNKGSERWLCYGGAAGIVRCQRI